MLGGINKPWAAEGRCVQLFWSRPGAEFERKRGHRHGGGGEGDTEDVATATGLVGSFESPQSTESHEALQQQLRHCLV